MSSLWKRANGPQQRMLKIVSGAVLNAAHAHPGRPVDRTFARSVAKRAVGTLSVQWTEVLAQAASVSSEPSSGSAANALRNRRTYRRGSDGGNGGESQGSKARPYVKLCGVIGRRVRPLRMAGDDEAADALEAAIKAIAPIVRRECGKASSIKGAQVAPDEIG